MIKRILGLLIGLLLLTACQPKTYDYAFESGGFGGPGWPIWVEDLIINEAWQVPAGNMSGGPDDTDTNLPGSSIASVGHAPLPETIRARWFSYRTQTFYQATLEIPADKRTQIRLWFKQYPRKKYIHNLVTGISGQGMIQAWWFVGCVGFGCPEKYESHYFELTSEIKATKDKGDPNQYYNTTREHIREGTIPPEVLNLVPPLENPPKENPYVDILNIETTE